MLEVLVFCVAYCIYALANDRKTNIACLIRNIFCNVAEQWWWAFLCFWG